MLLVALGAKPVGRKGEKAFTRRVRKLIKEVDADNSGCVGGWMDG